MDTMSKLRRRVLLLLIGLAGVCLVRFPAQSAEAVRWGLMLCTNTVLPALFPFLILSSLLVELGVPRQLEHLLAPVMGPLFGVGGAGAAPLVLGLVGGCPVGARTAAELYANGQCSRAEAQRLLCFCHTCGPAFILGVVGGGIFGDTRIGLFLYLIHIGSALLVGYLLGQFFPLEAEQVKPGPAETPSAGFGAALTHSVTGAVRAGLSITGFILAFGVLTELLRASGLFALAAGLLTRLGCSPETADCLLTGLLEVSSGLDALPDGALLPRLALAAFLLGWGGVSAHCQVLACTSGLSVGPCLLSKLLQGLCSALLVLLCSGGSILPAVTFYLLCVAVPPIFLHRFCGKRKNNGGKKKNFAL